MKEIKLRRVLIAGILLAIIYVFTNAAGIWSYGKVDEKRAMLMAEDYGIQVYSSPTPTSMYKSTVNKLKFLAREVFFYVGYKIYRMF